MEIAEERRVVCKVCLKQFSRYTCPRCNVAYCSLPCFKQHGESCTESFYRDQVDGEMRGLLTNDADKRAVLSILKRFHEDTTADAAAGPMTAAFGGGGGGESDDEGGADGNGEDGGDGDDEDDDGGDALFGLLSDESLERLLAKVAAAAEMAEPGDIDALMAQLSVDESDVTPSELRALAAAAARGALSSTLLPWQPWWAGEAAVGLRLSANGTPLVTEVPSTSSASGAGGSSSDSRGGGGGGAEGGGGDAAAAAGAPRPPPSPLPCMPTEPLPPLASLSSVPPSAALRWHVLDVLLSYCLIMRLYNGDVSGGCEADAASSMFAASAALLAASGQPQPRQGKPQQQQQQGAGKRLGGGAPAPGSVQQQQQREQQREQREQQQPPAPELPVTASSACLGFLSRACRPPVGDATQLRAAVAALRDASVLLGAGRGALIVALAHARGLAEAAAAQVACAEAQVSGSSSGSSSSWVRGRGAAAAQAQAHERPLRARRHAATAAARKLAFLMSWANEQDEGVLEAMRLGARDEWEAHTAAIGGTAGDGAGLGVSGARGAAAMTVGGGAAALPSLLVGGLPALGAALGAARVGPSGGATAARGGFLLQEMD